MPVDFRDYLKLEAKKIDQVLDKYLDNELKRIGKISPKLTSLFKDFVNASRGGKRLRGTLVKLGYELTGKIPNPEIYQISSAFEIFQTAILTHDDIIDQSLTRRGKPSLYQAVGQDLAITLADLGFFLSINIISESKFDMEKKNKAINLFSKVVVDTTIGQMLDILHADPVTVAKLKTARYTIGGPLQVGGVLAGAGSKLISILGEFGENLGIAYQIRDDILDGEVLDEGEQQALKYAETAKKMIPQIIKDVKYRLLLDSLADYLIKRSS